MENLLNEIIVSVKTFAPNFLAALAILIVGWIFAMIVAALLRGVLRRVGINNRIQSMTTSEKEDNAPDIENGVAKGFYYLIMLFVLVAFFQALRITLITEPLTALLNQIFQFVPQLIGAGLLLLTAWVVAKLSKIIVLKVTSALKVDARLATRMQSPESTDEEVQPIALSKSIADAVYGLVFLLFLPAVLGALSLDGLLAPVQGMISKLLGFLPNLATAGIILLIGWFVARLVQQIVTNLLAAVGLDNLSEKLGLASVLGSQKLSSMLGLVLYALMLIPVAIAALNTLQLDSITQPASNMLNMILAAIPNIFAAAVIIGISYVIGRMVASLVTNLLTGVGFDSITQRLGIAKEIPEGNLAPSRFVGHLVLLAILFFAVLEAANLLGFAALSALVTQFMMLVGHILFGLVIFSVGLFVANLVAKLIHTAGIARADLFATTSRITILIFAGAIALRHMGLANEIINLAFGLSLGAVALAIAIAVGLGSREIAAREINQLIETMRSKT